MTVWKALSLLVAGLVAMTTPVARSSPLAPPGGEGSGEWGWGAALGAAGIDIVMAAPAIVPAAAT